MQVSRGPQRTTGGPPSAPIPEIPTHLIQDVTPEYACLTRSMGVLMLVVPGLRLEKCCSVAENRPQPDPPTAWFSVLTAIGRWF